MSSQESGSIADRTFFGHPRGLATLFFTEMWERFSYYGMRALLILFMTEETISANPGMGYDVTTSAAIYGLYTSLVYLLSLPGGWVADNIWGQRKAVFVGGCIIALGHFTMAVPSEYSFFLGLILIILGTGLLKPNVSTVVGELYPEGGARRDAGFSVFYMGINMGALIGPLLCSFLGENYNWHWGFSLAGIGMVLGLIQFRMGYKHLGDAGLLRSDDQEDIARKEKKFYVVTGVVAAVLVTFGFLVSSGVLPLTLTEIATFLGSGILILVALYFIYLLGFAGHTKDEKKRIGAIIWLFLLSAIFWSGFEQAGSSLNLFGRDFTDRMVFGWEMPAGWLQSVNSTFIIILAPLFGILWIWLAKRSANPSIPMKFALGLLGLAAGFFVISWGAANSSAENPSPMAWLIVMYFLHTVGELCLSPVGLSSITKLAPVNRVGQMMGIWFVGTALGNLFAGLVAGQLETLAPSSLFWNVALMIGGAGVLAVLFSPPIRKLIKGVD